MLDIDGFVTSPTFLAQIAAIIAALFSSLAASIVNGFLGIS